jgi:ACR3 family arsenite efflux pump ArsB
MNLIRFAVGAAIALTAIVSLAPAANAHTAKKSTTHTYSLQAISVFPKGSNDFNNPVAVALISFG